jgi:hypothetical protein
VSVRNGGLKRQHHTESPAKYLGKDGSVFADVGDASPSNVNKAVAKHFPRVAATRAAARALRHGLNVTMVAFEELD